MGGFASLLGHAASGYNAAHEADTQRQFADLASRRAMAGEILSQIALDPNQHPEVRNLALQGRLGLSQEKPTADFNTKKYFDPLLTMMAKYRQPQGQQAGLTNQPPAPPPGLGIQGLPPVSANAPALTAQPPTGGFGPQQAPASIAPPTATPSQQMMGAGTQQYTPQLGTPPPPPADIAQAAPAGLLAGPAEIAQNAATMAGATAGGTMQGQIAARQAALARMPGLPPELQAGFALGVPMYGAMNRTVGAGGGYAGELRKQGEAVPTNIPDDQWVNLKELGSGRKTYEPGAAPGEKAGGGGTLIDPTEQAQRNAAIRYGYWSKENKTQFGQRLALQDNAFNNAVQRGFYGDADKIFTGAVKDYQLGLNRARTMDANYADALKGNQQAMVSLVMNHIGMTAGAQPGMRMARATIEEAIKSAPWLSTHVNKWFHQDETGDYIFDGLKGGVTLTKPQMEQMVGLAHQKVNVLHDTVGAYQEALNPSTMEFQAPGMQQAQRAQRPAISAPSSKKKPPASEPPAPPANVRPPLSSFGPH